jgi:hypothetical protein
LIISLPVALLLQSIGHFLGHIPLVMFRQNRIGLERAGDVESTLCDRSLTLPEQVGQLAAIGNRYLAASVRQREMDGKVIAAREAALLHQSADAHALPRRNVLLDEIGRRIEEHNRVPEGKEHEPHRERNRSHRTTYQSMAHLPWFHCSSLP